MNQQRREPTENQQISVQQTQQAALNRLMREIASKRRDIEAILPADIKFEKFQACLNMAIRREPKLLDCTGPSLIRAAIMSAYDGLLPDGKEAVIVYRLMSFKLENGAWSPKKRLEASYMPMAFGLRKKIIEAGAARHIKATCVYQNDVFEWEEGLHERLVHKPFLGDERDMQAVNATKPDEPPPPDPRGPLIAVYSVAILPEGDKVFEVMPRREVMKVKAKAQTKDVWEGPFEAEMWRKSVIRRHSKALPAATPIRDAEAEVMFPDFNGVDNSQFRLGPPPPRPKREDFDQLGAPEVDLPLDLSGLSSEGEMREEVLRDEPKTQARGKRQPAKQKEQSDDDAKGADDSAGQGQSTPAGPQPLAAPTSAPGWEDWKRKVLTELGACQKVEALDSLQDREMGNIENAPDKIKNAVSGDFLAKRLDLQEQDDA